MEEGKGSEKNVLLRAWVPEDLKERISLLAEGCGIPYRDLAKQLIVAACQWEEKRLREGGRPVRKTSLNISIPAETAEFLTRQAEERQMYRSQYLQSLLLGMPSPGPYYETGHGGDVNVRVTFSPEQLEQVDRLAEKARISRTRYIRETALGTPREMPVYLDMDMTALEPVFRDLETVAQSMQELVLRPDRSEEERAESRKIQIRMLEEIRRIRQEMERWGEDAIADTQALLGGGQTVRKHAGLPDLPI